MKKPAQYGRLSFVSPSHTLPSPLQRVREGGGNGLLTPNLDQERGENQRNHGHQLDQDVHGGSGGVLERVTYGVADDGGFVVVRAFPSQIALLDVLLGVVPGAAGIGHKESQEHAHDVGSRLESPKGLLTDDEARSRGDSLQDEYVRFCLSGEVASYQSGAVGYILFRKHALLRCTPPESLGKIPARVWHDLRFVKAPIKGVEAVGGRVSH
jgi:hypothetical protein